MQREEFDTWLEEHYDDLWRVARARVNSAADASDVVQTAILTIYRTRLYEASVKPWTRVALTVRGTASNFRRSEWRTLRALEKVAHAAGASTKWKGPHEPSE
jgi:DNA-directed RNA polymerase specialized sigma24 family protein